MRRISQIDNTGDAFLDHPSLCYISSMSLSSVGNVWSLVGLDTGLVDDIWVPGIFVSWCGIIQLTFAAAMVFEDCVAGKQS